MSCRVCNNSPSDTISMHFTDNVQSVVDHGEYYWHTTYNWLTLLLGAHHQEVERRRDCATLEIILIFKIKSSACVDHEDMQTPAAMDEDDATTRRSDTNFANEPPICNWSKRIRIRVQLVRSQTASHENTFRVLMSGQREVENSEREQQPILQFILKKLFGNVIF